MKEIRANTGMRTNNPGIIFVELNIVKRKSRECNLNAYKILHACCARLVDAFQVLQNKMCVTINNGDANIIIVLILPKVIDIRFTVTYVDGLPSRNSHEYVKNQ